MLPKLTAEFSAAMSRIKTEHPDMLRTVARNGQLRALEQAVAPEIKVAQYEHLNYVVLRPAEAIPLGDSAVIFEIEADRMYTTFLSTDDRLVAAYMPLTTNLVLCGYAGTTTPKTRDLPVAVARCSREFFVAHADSEWFQNLHPLISQLSVIIDQIEIERLLYEAFEP